MLNARYKEVSPPWLRSTLMSAQLPPPVPELTGALGSSTAVSNWQAAEPLNEQLEGWRKARLLEYSRELCLIERLHAEIRMLREKVAVQHGHAAVLMAENSRLKLENATITREFEEYRLRRARREDAVTALEASLEAETRGLQKVLHGGFDEVDPAGPQSAGSYGRGWYFSKYPAHAHRFTGGGGCMLLADVAVGNTETVVRRDASRGAPSAGFDSIVVPGRSLPSQVKEVGSTAAAEVNEEYVIFDASQALPLCLLFYDAE